MPSTAVSEWHPDAEKTYVPVKPLGRGSFGTVWKAKKRIQKAQNVNCDNDDDHDDEYVAIKNIDVSKKSGKAYAEREIIALSELRHPNIIRLIRAYDPVMGVGSSGIRSRTVVMSLASGPNLHNVVNFGGALGIPLARLVARQLVAAVSYMHGRAVLHRDIKPDNLILVNSTLPTHLEYDWEEDDAIWSDGADAEERVKKGGWCMVLVDFGFARALTPNEVNQQETAMPSSIVKEKEERGNMLKGTSFRVSRDRHEEDTAEAVQAMRGSLHKQETPNFRDIEEESSQPEKQFQLNSNEVKNGANKYSIRRVSRRDKRGSVARMPIRAMSALGTKAFAAPEIKDRFRDKSSEDQKRPNVALAKCVADYGMVVDAYSVGATIRVVLTGVPPDENLTEYIVKARGEELRGRLMLVFACCTPGKKKGRRRQFRDSQEVPKDAARLVRDLTRSKASERMTVREAQLHPWICGGDDEEPHELPCGDIPSKHGDPVVFLKRFTKEEQNG